MHHPYKFLGALALAAIAACSSDTTGPTITSPVLDKGSAGGSGSSSTNIVVTESDISRQTEDTPPLRSWVFYTRAATPATGSFVVGPSIPPLGVGSFLTGTPLATDKGTLFNFDHAGTRLADITAIRYATYRDPASTATAGQLPSINIQVDANGAAPGGFTTLVFEPIYNPAQGAIQNGVWQTWNGINGIWWSTRDINGVCAVTCYVSWNDIVSANPDAVILGGFGVNQGTGNGGLIAATDALEIRANGTTWIYNFEPFRTAVTKDDCKNGGWQSVKAADGSSFRNQGQCVSYVNHQNHGSD
ncbi:MAG: hypothetical protein ACJ8AC_09115 [Gemmatimonadaceae bacterium]